MDSGAIGIVVTAVTLWLALVKLAEDYAAGLQVLGEAVSPPRRARSRRRIEALIDRLPFRWWLGNPTDRASFLLTTAYIVRDRETKLRLYPSLAPMLVIPFVFLLHSGGRAGGPGASFATSFSGAYAGLIPMLALGMLRYSGQWQAAEIFRAAPIDGPEAICRGARRAIMLLLTLPMLAVFTAIIWFIHTDASQFLLFLPGLITLPVYSLVPNLGGRGVPLSIPSDEAKAAARGLTMLGAIFFSMAISFAASMALATGWFWQFIGIESLIAGTVYFMLRSSIVRAKWPESE